MIVIDDVVIHLNYILINRDIFFFFVHTAFCSIDYMYVTYVCNYIVYSVGMKRSSIYRMNV